MARELQMTIPERTPLAVDHGLNQKRITALVELLKTEKTDAHHATLVSLRDKKMVGFYGPGTSRPYLTAHGKEVAQGLIELDDEPEETVTVPVQSDGTFSVSLPAVEDVSRPGSFSDDMDDIAAISDPSVSDVKPLTAAHQVLCRGRRSGEHSQLIAVVVGSESDAQRVADQWNLAHLADIAAHADATFAVAVPAEVGVYLFERFAVVEH